MGALQMYIDDDDDDDDDDNNNDNNNINNNNINNNNKTTIYTARSNMTRVTTRAPRWQLSTVGIYTLGAGISATA